MTKVRCDGVSKRYGDVPALEMIDLAVQKGEFLTLLGPSGSGKTTLLNLIAGLLAPSHGRIWIDGVDATDIPPSKRGVGMVFQNYALMPHMTIFKNIAFPLEVRRLSRSEIERSVREVLDLVRLPEVADRKPKQLSGGQQQRVALARALVYNPSIVLMDEPLGALDRKLREQMQLELKRLHTQLGITVLYVTHDQEEALTMSDRIVLLNHGRIEQMGAPHELYFRPRSTFAAEFFGDSNMMDAIVEAVGDTATVVTSRGQRLRAQSASFVQTGQSVKVMVRPENLSIVQSSNAAFDNLVTGEILDSILLGGVLKHHIRLDDGTAIIVQELNRPTPASVGRGDRVRVGWQADASLVLPCEGAVGA